MNTSNGGCGGNAEVEGDDSSATGGDGGGAVIGDGGRGGNARTFGNRSVAIGGKGGRGGIGPGQPGGDVAIHGDDTFAAGGQGGEASQLDGRGGRGGRVYEINKLLGTLGILGMPDRGHIKAPYGRPNIEPGRGGDAPDTPRYMAQKLIIMALKERYFTEKQIEPRDLDVVWYDRTIVPLEWLNETLLLRGHKWRVRVEDDEYVFNDESENPDPPPSSVPNPTRAG